MTISSMTISSPMNPKVKAKWIAALRSGRYKQTKSVLKNMLGNCCLGVLCETLRVRKIYDVEHSRYLFKDKKGYLEHSTSLPLNVRTSAGLTRPIEDRLAEMNDLDKMSFNQIADWIEKNL